MAAGPRNCLGTERTSEPTAGLTPVTRGSNSTSKRPPASKSTCLAFGETYALPRAMASTLMLKAPPERTASTLQPYVLKSVYVMGKPVSRSRAAQSTEESTATPSCVRSRWEVIKWTSSGIVGGGCEGDGKTSRATINMM